MDTCRQYGTLLPRPRYGSWLWSADRDPAAGRWQRVAVTNSTKIFYCSQVQYSLVSTGYSCVTLISDSVQCDGCTSYYTHCTPSTVHDSLDRVQYSVGSVPPPVPVPRGRGATGTVKSRESVLYVTTGYSSQ